MAELKIALVGAGSFVFGPSMLAQAILEHRLSGIELALVDVDAEMLGLMAGVGRRMADHAGVRLTITTHTDRATAFAGADFVICAAAREMHRRFSMDVEIINRHLPGHVISEFGGVAGISYSLRQIALIEEIAADMRAHCPDAWLLNVSNPLPRVCQAAHEAGIRTVGFCSVSISVYDMLWRIFQGEPIRYPFTPAREQFRALTAGLNHFAWLLKLTDPATGADLLPRLAEAVAAGGTAGSPASAMHYQRRGYLLVPQDDHTRDFLFPEVPVEPLEEPSHGTPLLRQQRLELMAAIAEGRASWDPLLTNPSWERPLDLIVALSGGPAAEFHSLNLINTGQISNLPAGVFVETPCAATGDGIQPQAVTLPDEVLALCGRTVLVTQTIVAAARLGSRMLVHDAVELDPTILDKRAGFAAIDDCLTAHADLLPRFQ